MEVNITFSDHTTHAIVGENGSGKTTLLRLISGIETLDSGSISMTPQNSIIAYAKQELEKTSSMTVEEFLKQEIGILALERRMQEYEDFLHIPEKLEAYGELLSQYESQGGYDFENVIHEAFCGLGIAPLSMSTQIHTLSSGQRSKVSLAANLVKKSDIIVLDEPTNNLDRE